MVTCKIQRSIYGETLVSSDLTLYVKYAFRIEPCLQTYGKEMWLNTVFAVYIYITVNHYDFQDYWIQDFFNVTAP